MQVGCSSNTDAGSLLSQFSVAASSSMAGEQSLNHGYSRVAESNRSFPMIVFQITEVQMLVETNDDAAVLRLQQTTVKCVQATPEELAILRRKPLPECRDCGKQIV